MAFTVSQKWKNSDLSWLSVLYTSPGSAGQSCPKSSEVGPSTTLPPYIAACSADGFANVTLYIHDGSIPASPDITSSIPEICKPSKDTGHKCALNFRLPCGPC